MRKRTVWISLLLALPALVIVAQQSDVIIKLTQGDRPGMAVPDFRGAGDSQKFMDAFNSTLWQDLETSGLFRMVSKSIPDGDSSETPGFPSPVAAARETGTQARCPGCATQAGPARPVADRLVRAPG